VGPKEKMGGSGTGKEGAEEPTKAARLRRNSESIKILRALERIKSNVWRKKGWERWVGGGCFAGGGWKGGDYLLKGKMGRESIAA